MSQIEFVVQPGYSFTAALYDPYDDYAVLATGLAVTHLGNGVYRRDTGSVTGIVYMVATAGALRVVGYANLDEPGENTFSEVFDTLAEAEAAGVGGFSELVDAIDLLNAKIQTGVITVVSPVNTDGSVNPIVIGDDYLTVNGRSIDVFIDPIPGVAVETATCTLGLEAKHKGDVLVTGLVAAVTVNALPKWRMRYELEYADTIECKPGCYDWTATLLSAAGKRITRVQGQVELVASQTIE
jgi:hypothetical protein